ncbi:MAG: hypothetical protein V1494_01075 [Candidatus Diapherotrites archaeon]
MNAEWKNRINLWINSVTNPEETFAAEKAKASLDNGFFNYSVAGLISVVFYVILNRLFCIFRTSSMSL